MPDQQLDLIALLVDEYLKTLITQVSTQMLSHDVRWSQDLFSHIDRVSVEIQLIRLPAFGVHLTASVELECLSRGLYRLVDMPELSGPDLVTVAHRIPDGVVCLISALHFHHITTQIPHEVSVAINRVKKNLVCSIRPIESTSFLEKPLVRGYRLT